MRVLLTGANGFLGSHVAERLAVREDVSLRLLLRRTSKLDFLSECPQTFDVAFGDLRDEASLDAALAGVDAVAHLGGLTAARTVTEYQAVNAAGTARVVAASRRAGVKRFVYVSSLAAQGPSPDGRPPAPGTTHPVSPYGQSKLDGEAPVLAARDAMSVAILRPPIIYGPRDLALLPLYRIIKTLRLVPLYGDGHAQLSFVHVHDCADAIVAMTLADGPNGGTYGIADGRPHSWRDVGSAFAAALGSRPRLVCFPERVYRSVGYTAGAINRLLHTSLPLDQEVIEQMRQRYWVIESDAIARDYAWRPQFDITAGMAQTVAWYRAHGWL